MASRTDCAVAVSGISHATSARHAHVLTEYLSRTKRTPAVSAVKSETLSPCGVTLTTASPRGASAEISGTPFVPASHSRRTTCVCLVAHRQLPARPDEMARIAVRDALEIILVFRLRFPERARRSHLRHHAPRPQPGSVDVGDGVLGDSSLLVAGREDGGTVAGAHVVALAIACCRVVNLEEELQQFAKAESFRIEDDLDRFGVSPVTAIRRVRNVTARIADTSGNDTIALADEVLHAPEAAACKYRSFLCHWMSSIWSRKAP